MAREGVGGGATEAAGPARGGVVDAREGVECGGAGGRGAAEGRVGEDREEVGRRGVERRAEHGGGDDERRRRGGRGRPRVPRPPEALHRLQLREVHRNRIRWAVEWRLGFCNVPLPFALLPFSNLNPFLFSGDRKSVV